MNFDSIASYLFALQLGVKQCERPKEKIDLHIHWLGAVYCIIVYEAYCSM